MEIGERERERVRLRVISYKIFTGQVLPAKRMGLERLDVKAVFPVVN